MTIRSNHDLDSCKYKQNVNMSCGEDEFIDESLLCHIMQQHNILHCYETFASMGLLVIVGKDMKLTTILHCVLRETMAAEGLTSLGCRLER